MAATQYPVDSNILLRWVKPDHSDHQLAALSLAISSGTGRHTNNP